MVLMVTLSSCPLSKEELTINHEQVAPGQPPRQMLTKYTGGKCYHSSTRNLLVLPPTLAVSKGLVLVTPWSVHLGK